MKHGDEMFVPLCKKRMNCISTFKRTGSFKNIFIIAAIFHLNFKLCFSACAQAEYEMDNEECCPMCAPGNRVYRHCTEFTSTTCVPCDESTYTAEPNGLPKCLICTMCDSEQGLRIKSACTRTLDTVCQPLDGYYCTDLHKDSCRQAIAHTKCHAGHYIKKRGTAFEDTVCAECPDGTFSNGSLEICQQYTKCEKLELTEIKPGTISSDVLCGVHTSEHLLLILVPVFVSFVAGAVLLSIYLKKKHKSRQLTDASTDQTQPMNMRPMIIQDSF